MKPSNHSIKWDLLSDDELFLMAGYGVQMKPSGITFNRILTLEQYMEIGKILSYLKERTGGPEEENHILFALGDWYNAIPDTLFLERAR